VKRGDIWLVAGGGDYTGKPRPAVILQDDRFDATDSVTVAALTTDPTDAPLFRVLFQPTPGNGLDVTSRVMADKITTVPRTRLQRQIGRLGRNDITRLNQAVLVFLGFATSQRRQARPNLTEGE
jgi:mRNA interferase MazF